MAGNSAKGNAPDRLGAHHVEEREEHERDERGETGNSSEEDGMAEDPDIESGDKGDEETGGDGDGDSPSSEGTNVPDKAKAEAAVDMVKIESGVYKMVDTVLTQGTLNLPKDFHCTVRAHHESVENMYYHKKKYQHTETEPKFTCKHTHVNNVTHEHHHHHHHYHVVERYHHHFYDQQGRNVTSISFHDIPPLINGGRDAHVAVAGDAPAEHAGHPLVEQMVDSETTPAAGGESGGLRAELDTDADVWALFSWEASSKNPDLVECGSGFRKPQKILPLAAMAFQPKDYKASTSTSTSSAPSSAAPASATTVGAPTSGQAKCDRMCEDEQAAANKHDNEAEAGASVARPLSPDSPPFDAGSDSDASMLESLNKELKKGRKTKRSQKQASDVHVQPSPTVLAKAKSEKPEKPRLKVVLKGPDQQTLTRERFDHFFDRTRYQSHRKQDEHGHDDAAASSPPPPPPRDCATPQRKKREPEIEAKGDQERVREHTDEDVKMCGGGEKLSGEDVSPALATSGSISFQKPDVLSCPTLHASDQSDQSQRAHTAHDVGDMSDAATLCKDGLPNLRDVPSVHIESPQVEVPDVPMPDQRVSATNTSTAECGSEKTSVAATGVASTLLDTPGSALDCGDRVTTQELPAGGHTGDGGECASDAAQGDADVTIPANPVNTVSVPESEDLPSHVSEPSEDVPHSKAECLSSGGGGPPHVHDHGANAEHLEKQQKPEKEPNAEGQTFLFGPPGPGDFPEEVFDDHAKELWDKYDKSIESIKFIKSDKSDKSDKFPDLPPDVESARSRPNKYLARNLLEGLAFPNDAMHFMDNDEEFFGRDALMRVLNAASSDSMSTPFSGIEAPHTASCANRIALAQYLGIPVTEIPMPRLLNMVEWGAEEQRELLVVCKQTGSCLFGDIAEFFRPELQDTVAFLKDVGGSGLVFLFGIALNQQRQRQFKQLYPK
eukprot:s1602_g19.t1